MVQEQERGDAKVLIVEDNIYTNMALVALVSSFVNSYDSAYDGDEALRCVKEKFEKYGTTYQLIIMDYRMPYCNGLQASKNIREFLADKLPQ